MPIFAVSPSKIASKIADEIAGKNRVKSRKAAAALSCSRRAI
jgi:hypothetical protein